jgi:hypothetical protein
MGAMRLKPLVLGLTLGALLAGCGGSETPNPGDEYVRRVDALCRQARPQLAEINQALIRARDAGRSGRVSLPRTFETFSTLLGRASKVGSTLRAGLGQITPPPAERDFHAELLAAIDQGNANVKRQIDAAQRRDAAGLRDLSTKGTALNERTKGLVTGHGGFRFCGRS